MPAIGYVTRQEDGSFKGQLRTLTIRADIEIMKNRTEEHREPARLPRRHQWR